MVFFITGVPGSGKTYYLVNYAESKINDYDKKTNDKTYLQVVHNISGYKNGYYVDFGVDYLPKILSLNDYYKSIKKDINKDDLLIAKAEELGIYKILLIVDECHLYFVNDFSEKGKKSYYALLWFISYHRHLFVDIVLSTQNLSLVDYKFKAFAEFYVKAVPSSMRFNINPFSAPKFTYYYYPDSRMYNDSKFRVEKLKASPDIFGLYTSGDSVKKQKVYMQTLLIILLLLVVSSLLWYMFKRSFSPSVSVESNSSSQSNSKELSSVTKPVVSDSNISSRTDKKFIPNNDSTLFQNEDTVFDVLVCSDLTGDCNSHLTDKSLHMFFFKRMKRLKLFKVLNEESQYGLHRYYIVLNISKSSYLSKFLINHFNSSKDPPASKKSFSIDYGDIKDEYESAIKDRN